MNKRKMNNSWTSVNLIYENRGSRSFFDKDCQTNEKEILISFWQLKFVPLISV